MNTFEVEKSLTFFCKSHSSFKTRLGVFSLYKAHFPAWLDKIILSIEYLQLLSLTILIHPNVTQFSDADAKNPLLFEIVIYALKIVNPSYLLSFSESDSTTVSVLGIILGYMLFKYLILIYALYVSSSNKEPNRLLRYAWRLIVKIQGRITCCFITSFWTRAIVSVSNESFSIQGISDGAIVAVSAVLMVLEYVFSFFLETQFCDFLPTKRYLSAKNNEMQILTLLQKLVIHLIQLFVYNNAVTDIWVCIILNLAFSLIRVYRFFTTLPLYNYGSLLFQGNLIAITLSLHVAHCLQQALSSSPEYLADIRFLIILWIIMGVMSCKISNTLIAQTYVRLLTTYEKENSELLLHKVTATKYLIRSLMVPEHNSEKSDIKHLLSTTESLNLLKVFNLNLSAKSPNITYTLNNKQEITQIFLDYLQNLSSLYPKDPLIKLNLAYRNYKSRQSHAKIIKILSTLNENTWSSYFMSSALLLHDLKRTTAIHDIEEEDSETLNLTKYIESQLLLDDLKNEILKQIDLKKQICNNVINETPNLETIYQNAQIIHKSKLTIQKKMSYLMNHIPEYCLNPLLVFAEYSLLLNYSIEKYHKYFDSYSRKFLKFAKELELNGLCEENIYQDNNAFLIISGEKQQNGYVVYSTKSLQNICGFDRGKYQGIHITKLFPPSLRGYYDEMFKEIFEKGHNEITNQIIHTYLYHKEGYLIEADIFIKIHPYVNQNLYINMLIRPSQSYEDMILVNENGRIEGATQAMARSLEIDQLSKPSTTPLSLKQISEELATLNNAFNVVKKKDDAETSETTLTRTMTSSSVYRRQRTSMYNRQKTSGLFAHRHSSKLKSFVSAVEAPFDYQKALELYNYYISSENTKGIEIFPSGGGRADPFNQPRAIGSFKCQISSLKFGTNIYNLISLEKVSDNKDQDPLESQQQIKSDDEDSTSIPPDLQERENIEQIPSLRPHSLVTQEIYLSSALKDSSRNDNKPKLFSMRTTRFNDTENEMNLISPTSTRVLLKTCLSSPRNPHDNPKLLSLDRKISYNFENNMPPSSSREKKEDVKNFKAIIPSPSSHEYSKISQISNVFKTFERAVTSKSYQRSFNFLCVIFYGVIILTLSCEIILKVVLDNTMNSLITKTDLLNCAQLRTYAITKIQNTARGAALTLSGSLTSAQLNVADQQLKKTLVNMQASLDSLVEANDGIIQNIDSEDQEMKQIIFEKNILIKGSALDPSDSHTELLTSFQLVDVVTAAINSLMNLDSLVTGTGARAFSFLINNCLDGFLAKNDEITQAFLNSLNKQKSNLQTMINLSVIILPLMLVGIILLLAVIIWHQYRTEKRYLLAFLKLNPLMIQHILENLKLFQKKIINQEKFESELVPNLIYKLEHSLQFKGGYHKNESPHKIQYKNMKARYVGYIFKVLFYIVLLITIVIVNYIYISRATKKIYRQQTQIQFANEISNTMSVTYVSEVESFASNNTIYVMQEPPFDQFQKGLAKVKEIQTNLYSGFQQEDGDFDPEVKALLFEEVSCDRFIASSYDLCLSLNSLGQSTKMVSLVALYKNYMDTKLLQFLAVDRSSFGALIGTAVINLSYGVASFSVSTAEAQLINEVIRKNLTQSVDDIFDLGTDILIIFSLTLFVVSVLIWMQILTKVKEVNNDFKNVLAVFPPNIILSSFLLKSFLNKTSNNITQAL